MRTRTRAFLLITALTTALSMGGAFANHDGTRGCAQDSKHTAAGSCKDKNNHQIHCGSNGRLPVQPGGVGVHANQTSNDGVEAEACSDQGPGNQHGRLIVEVNPDERGARVVLDSDPDQPFPPGWIIVQGSAKDGNKNGVYCSADEGDGPPDRGDGYKQTWGNPGAESGVDCVPESPV